MSTRPPVRDRPAWPGFLDGAGDGLVLAFAAWTVFYELALAFQFSMGWAGWPWIVLAACLATAAGAHAMRATAVVADSPQQTAPPRARPGLPGQAVQAVLVAAVIVLVLRRGQGSVWPIAATAIVLLLVQLLPLVWRAGASPAPDATPAQQVSQVTHLLALAASAGFGLLGLFLLRPDADDVFYVNRAAWVAEHGTAATNDTMFSANTLPPALDGGVMTPSVEALQGVLAHALGIQAATLCYLLAVPVLGAMAGWTTWRLVRAWAPRRPALVMTASMLFLLASAASIVGNYSLGRIWQGKVTAYAIVIPLVWMFLSRTIERARRADLVMLGAAGVAFVGLTTTSALVSPLIAGSALVAAALLRSRSLALGAAVFLAAPLANGLVQTFGPAQIGGGEGSVIPPEGIFALAFGSAAAMAALGLVALLLAGWLAPGSTGVLLSCGALATMVALLPGVADLADAATGAGAVAWRLAITMPTWVLVGLLVSLPVPRLRSEHSRLRTPAWLVGAGAAASVAVIAVVLVVPLAAGTWLWKGAGAALTDRPTWKVDQGALADVRAAQKLQVPPGRWLLPPAQMEILAISTSAPYPVVPRSAYLPNLDVPEQDRADRELLLRFTKGARVPARAVRDALDRLDVTLACVPASDAGARKILVRAVRAQPQRVADMYCHIGRPGT
ncbi:DUF6077 domain-containing protein [Aeromicrobium wangtongii]|uniref:DUF6077 domain-containing protein n=1 Tax=Aeromicrobium wangtongii TaxID=2969247 RepID=A0ABY5MCR0_9ACTN|nr:DUF6077 domain-containing protein [Aeromicrobium wangtongii]MCD9199984.1 DUF6077 domain-containing protein [Aeromicrobium wangtongii]UUP13601.1 DUF6077 domain-containing protein [Aeromicrobium wangtongii]